MAAREITIATSDGYIVIREDQVQTLTDASTRGPSNSA
jgi:hypothetical protein